MPLQDSNKGFSLVSVLVALGMAGGLALLVMQISDNMLGVQQKGFSSLDSTELLTEFRMILEDDKNCRLSLAGEDPALNPVTFKKTDIDEPLSDPGLPIEVFLGSPDGKKRLVKKFSATDEAMSKYGKLTITNIRLFMNTGTGFDYPSTTNSDVGIIRIYYSYYLNKTKKDAFRDMLIRLSFTTDDVTGVSTIQSCSRESSGSGATDFETICKKFPGNKWDGTKCVSPNEMIKVIAFQLRYDGSTWAVSSTNVLFTDDAKDMDVNIAISSVEKISAARHKLRISFDGHFMDSTEVLTSQMISADNANMKLTINDYDGNNKIELIKSDDSSDNNWSSNDKINIIWAMKRM